MNADIRWLDDPEIFRVNQLPAHSDHEFYASEEEWSSRSEEHTSELQSPS